VSFIYPGTWEENGNLSIYGANNVPDSKEFAVVGTNKEVLLFSYSNGTNATGDLQKIANNKIPDYEMEEIWYYRNITVDGSNATMMKWNTPDKDGAYHTYVYWVKNKNTYFVTYITKSPDTSNLEKLLSTLKVN
jgi:hypothetical protein